MSSRTANRRPGPGWRVWVLSLGGAAVFVVALIVFVNRENSTANQPAPPAGQASVTEQNREARLLIERDQQPHVVSLLAGPAPPRVLRTAVVAFMKRQIAGGTIDGPVTRSSCARVSRSTVARAAFRCDVVAASVTYPFLSVVDRTTKQVTFCKRDAPPVPSMNIPVSSRCT